MGKLDGSVSSSFARRSPLGGRTSLDAVWKSDGIEAVEALLADAECHGENNPDMGELNRDGSR